MSYNPYHQPGQPPYPPYGGPPPPQGYPQAPYPQHPPSFGGPPGPPPPHGGHYPPPGPPHGGGGYNRPPPPMPPQSHGYPPPPGPGYPPQPYGGGPGYPPPGPMPPGPGHSPGPGPGYGHGPPPGGMPYGQPPVSMPSLGYAPGQTAPGDYRMQADALRKAMKGFGTDERALIQVLANLDPLQMAAVRETYSQHIKRDLYRDVKSETSGYLKQGLLAVIDGPLMHDAASVRESVEGAGTKEWLLNDVVLSRSNADLNAIKSAYESRFHRSLQKDIEGDLSFKTQGLFKMVLRANRHEDSTPINHQLMQDEARTIHSATAGRVVNNIDEVCGIFTRSSDPEIRAINHAFQERYHTSLEKHLESQFSGHMQDALLHMLRSATDPAMRDAVALEDCMRGMGTKDEKLVVRVVRVHWNRGHLQQVKGAYRTKYGKDLVDRVRGETSGDYQRLMVALLE